jgi:type IV pilus assembly protein PilE
MANRVPIRGRRGISLIETMVVVSIIGILASIGVPRFELALEQSKANIAQANLRAIWMGQRAYWLQNNAFAPDLATLRASNLLDSGIVDDTGEAVSSSPSLAYVYMISQFDSSSSSFTASARRVNSACSQGALTIDQDGNPGTGTIQMTIQSGTQTITPAFP